ncbi:cytochrome P450, partial [Nonomuraea sp. NPDC005983]|uniref:cytochrome P450 n=1 Tax=Nonomuraea sp. NPDC005983 TaxID=3155595 RepID=UPI0033B3F530
GFDRLNAAWQRVARRCVYGAGAAGDEELSALLAELRREAGRVGFSRGARRRHEILSGRYDARLLDHLRRAEPGSLAGLIASAPLGPELNRLRQAAFWLMGFSVTASGLLQTLALLATHPAQRHTAETDPDYLRACLQEGLRLWPPAPALSWVTTRVTDWYGTAVPAGTTVLVPIGLDQHGHGLPSAHRFVPEMWLDGTASDELWATPFGDRCKGMKLALLVGTAFLDGMLALARPEAVGRELSPSRPLPSTLNPLRLRVVMLPRTPRKDPA